VIWRPKATPLQFPSPRTQPPQSASIAGVLKGVLNARAKRFTWLCDKGGRKTR